MPKEYYHQTVYEFLFIDDQDYYQKVSDLYQYLDFLHLQELMLEQYIYTLSGGERVKIQILKLLLNGYDILFLDEPINDLDIETLEWLEQFICRTKQPIIYVFHDETLLSRTANRIYIWNK